MLMQPQASYKGPGQSFGYPSTQNPYPAPSSQPSRKKLLMMVGGGILLALLLLWVVFGGKSTPGQSDMQKVLQNTSDSVGILDEYQNDIGFSGTKNDMALVLVLLRGNYQELNELYNKTYKPKKKFAAAPQPDKSSSESLDSAKRSNQLDSKIVEVLEQKIDVAQKSLVEASKNFDSKANKEKFSKAQEDFKAISEILADQQ